MESNYGIGVANRYALFLDDEGGDLTEVTAKIPVAAKKSTAQTTTTKPANTQSTGKENKVSSTPAGKSKTTTPATNAAPAKGSPVNNTKPAARNNQGRDGQQQNRPPRDGNRPPREARDGNNNPQGKTTTASASLAGEGNLTKKSRREGPSKNQLSAKNQTSGPLDAQQSSQQTPRDSNNRRTERPPMEGSRPPRREGPRPPRDNNRPREEGETGERRGQPPRRFREDRGPLTSQNNPNFSAAGAPGEANPEEGKNRPFRERRVYGGGSRGGFGGRGPREGGNFSGERNNNTRDNRGKPFYDRHSGSDKAGVKATVKRDGAGPHNWGNINDDLAGQQGDLSAVPEGPVTSGEENNATDGDVAVDGTPAVDGEAAPVEQEEESKEMTLDEYKRLQSLEGKKKPKFDIRKPGEGQDTSKWKNTYLLDNKVEEELKVAVEHETEYEEVEVHVVNKEKKKKVIDIDIHFKDTFRENRRSDRGFGERGGFRGNRGDRREGDNNRGGFRGERPPRGEGRSNFGRNKAPSQAAPKVEDLKDFPSLVAA